MFFLFWTKKKPEIYALKNRTTLTIYCRHIGHSLKILPQFVQQAICPHSNITHSIGASIHILQISSVASFSIAVNKQIKLINYLKKKRLKSYMDMFYSRSIIDKLYRVIHFFHSTLCSPLYLTSIFLLVVLQINLPSQIWKKKKLLR